MAHLALTIDPDPLRRQTFLAQAAARLRSLPGLDLAQAEVGELAAVWAHGPTAPHSSHVAEGEFSLLLGYAIDETGRWLEALDVLGRWMNPALRGEGFDGYYAACAYSRSEGLVLGVDPVGLFPLYHTESDEALMAGTSAELFAAHPQFKGVLDLGGLTGIFLTNGLVGSRALLQGVRRLGVGCQLRRGLARKAQEVETWRLAPHADPGLRSEAEVREQVDAELRKAIRRHRPSQSATVLMLSGGMDSRLMGGYLRSEGFVDSAVTLGRPTDLEMPVAARVSEALGIPLHREAQEPEPKRLLESARRIAQWEHLACGFSALQTEASADTVGHLAPMFWSGFIVEEVLGGFGQDYAWNPRTRVWSCETLFTKLNEWGAPLPTLRKLLRSAEAEELIEAQLGVFRQDYERAEERPPQRAFRMKLATRVRFHLGASLHRLCFRSWPLLPILDRRLLDVLFNAPAEMLQDRRLEKDLLVRRFPVLARIPWEHNSFRLVPLQATGLCRIPLAQPAVTALRTKARRWYWQQWRKSEPRRYYRCYDLDGPWWRAVRAEAEAYRDRLDEWLDRPALDSLLPPPHVELRSRNPFSEGATQRLLLGLLLWTAPRDG